MNKYLTLIQRELWEHRNSVLLTPLVLFGLISLVNLFGFISISADDLDIQTNNNMRYTMVFSAIIHFFASLDPNDAQQTLQAINMLLGGVFNVIMVLIVLLYSFSALYDDRKDRSILFWKSMPVSDKEMVLAKLFTVSVIIPLSFVTFASLTQFVWLLTTSTVAWFYDVNVIKTIWQPTDILNLLANQFLAYLVNTLWALPLVAWGLLASAMARRAPFLYASVPVLVLIYVETVVLHSVHLGEWVIERFFGMLAFTGIGDSGVYLFESFDQLNPTNYNVTLSKLAHPQLWSGFIIALVFIAIAIKLRQLNDDAY